MAATFSVRLLLLALLPCVVLGRWRVGGPDPFKERVVQKFNVERRIQERTTDNFQFLNEKTQKYLVNGTSIPFIDWDLGESYAGQIPISKEADETRKLFFWFFPSQNPDASNEVTICSMMGLMQENGPFTWFVSAYRPVYNIFSWSQLSNMLYIDQPAGTGFSVGVANITTEEEAAQQFLGFYDNWMEAFGTKGRDTYLTGESYAGAYIPFFGDAMIKSKQSADYNLKGALMFSPYLRNDPPDFQQHAVTKPYVDQFNNVMGIVPGVLDYYDRIAAADEACGFAEMREKYFTFPPSGVLPPANNTDACQISSIVYEGLGLSSPCTSVYHVSQNCPNPSNPLGSAAQGDNASVPVALDRKTWHGYPNLPQLREAIHIPKDQKDWKECMDDDPFGPDGDQSLDSFASGTLKRVIEHTNNMIIGTGSQDYRVPTNGTLMVLQNLTWNGKQGYDEFPSKPFNLPVTYSDLSSQSAGSKVGDWVEQRGLTFVRVYLAGHELPAYAQGAAYRLLERLLGRVSDLAADVMYSALPGDFSTPESGPSL